MPNLKIGSWNIRFANSKYKRLFDYLYQQNLDVICLQEVREEALKYLYQKEGYNISPVKVAIGKKEKKNIYNVILSKHKIINKGEFKILDKEINSIWYYLVKFFFGLKKIDYIGQYVDLKEARIINLHLNSFVSPVLRINEFKQAVNYTKESYSGKTVFCGDFNTYGNVYLNFIPLLFMKLKLSEIKFNETKELKKIIEENNLKKAFYGKKTANLFNIIWKEIDHILVSTNTELVSNNVHKNSFGSDHNLIEAEISI